MQKMVLTLRGYNSAECAGTVNVLGLHIDAKLTWGILGEALSNVLCRAVFLLRRLSVVVDLTVLRTVYFAVFHSRMSYCLMVWGHSAILHRIFGLQRKAVRIIAGIGYRQDCRSAFVRLGILTLPDLYIYKCLLHVRRGLEQYTVNQARHAHNTRGVDDIYLERTRLYKSRTGVNYWGPKFYNALDRKIKDLPIKLFAKQTRELLLGKAHYNVAEYFDD